MMTLNKTDVVLKLVKRKKIYSILDMQSIKSESRESFNSHGKDGYTNSSILKPILKYSRY
ncbi:hypothetical protein BB561_006178 [Smittium simulii]|uniref:Uncharacterized protein n=1 Tax=Smittium simulii TaxID=133385 RepID=A0A2T9Y624_9FUNG|nr:hypothetical protein BB561_006178 [Smittium simulii]